ARGLPRGAIGALVKPVKEKETLDRVFESIRGHLDRREKELLLLSVDEREGVLMAESLAPAGVRLRRVDSPEEALGALDERRFDCVGGQTAAPSESLPALEEIGRQCGTRQNAGGVCTPPEAAGPPRPLCPRPAR